MLRLFKTPRLLSSILPGFILLLLSFSNAMASPSCCAICDCTPGLVWCENKGLTAVPVNIPSDVRRLYLFNNNISNIPTGVFSQLKNLEALDLSANQLTSEDIKPEVLDGLENLRDLTINENKLTHIEEKTFSGTPNLFRLYLNNNLIDTIADHAFDNLTSLVELKLGHNLLTKPPKLNNNLHLRRLCLDNNRLQRIGSKSFAGINLEQLSLSRNELNQLRSTAFGAISNMRILDISRNKLTRPPPIVRNMTFLHMLNLSGNHISSMPVNFLEKLKKIKILDLKGMQLTTLQDGFIPQKVYLNLFSISDNPWTCDCNIHWMISYIGAVSNAVSNLNEIRCSSPKALQGRQLVTLSKDLYCATAPTDNTLQTDPRSSERPAPRAPTIDVCDTLPCKNGATCYIDASTHQPICRCTAGWKGTLCDARIVPPIQPAPPKDPSQPSSDSTVKQGLFVNIDSITPHSVAILTPVVMKNITLTTTQVSSNGQQGKTSKRTIVPTVPLYTVRGLEPGTKYNICIILIDMVKTSGSKVREVEDQLCAIVTTESLITVPVITNENQEDNFVVSNPKEVLEVENMDHTQSTSAVQQNDGTSDTNSSTIMFIIAGASAGVILIIFAIGTALFCKRRRKDRQKHVNNNSEPPAPRSNGRLPSQTTHLQTINQQYSRTDPQTRVPLLNQNGDYYEASLNRNYPNGTASQQRVATPSKTESLGRSSNSGGSATGSIHRRNERQRCCSKSSDGHYSDPREDLRNLTPPNGNIQNIPSTYGDMRPAFNGREQEAIYNPHVCSTVPMDTYTETSFREPGVPISVVPVLSSNTNVNQFHHGPIATTAISPRTTYGYQINSPISMGSYPPGPSVARPQPVAMHYTPTKQLHYAEPTYLHVNGDVYNPNHMMDQPMKRTFIKTLAV